MTIDWREEATNSDSIIEQWRNLSNVCNKAIDEFVPIRQVKNRPFYDKKSAKLNRLKDKFHKRLLRNPSVVNKYNFLQISERLANHVAERQKKYAYEVFFNKGYKPKTFYNYINNNLKTNNDFTSLLRPDNSIATEYNEIADEFRSRFKRMFTVDDGVLPPVTPPVISQVVDVPKCTPENVISIMKRLNLNASPGPCGVPPKFLFK